MHYVAGTTWRRHFVLNALRSWHHTEKTFNLFWLNLDGDWSINIIKLVGTEQSDEFALAFLPG